MYHFFVANFFYNLLSFHFYTYQTTVTEFCEKSKIVSSIFSIIKKIVALFSSSLPMKLIYCFKSRFSNSICLLKSIAITLYQNLLILKHQICKLSIIFFSSKISSFKIIKNYIIIFLEIIRRKQTSIINQTSSCKHKINE